MATSTLWLQKSAVLKIELVLLIGHWPHETQEESGETCTGPTTTPLTLNEFDVPNGDSAIMESGTPRKIYGSPHLPLMKGAIPSPVVLSDGILRDAQSVKHGTLLWIDGRMAYLLGWSWINQLPYRRY